MTTYLDATALVALLFDEPAAETVASLFDAGSISISVVNYGEALDTVARARSTSAEAVARVVQRMASSALTLQPVTADIALRGASVRARHYHRSSCSVSLADCIAVAAARGTTLATADRDQATVAREEGVKVIELPSSASR